jgi:hypothetical protein
MTRLLLWSILLGLLIYGLLRPAPVALEVEESAQGAKGAVAYFVERGKGWEFTLRLARGDQ